MERKRLTREELLERKDELVESYYAASPKSKKPFVLTKKERKILGIGRDRGTAKLTNVRIAPRKVNIVLDLIRGKDLKEAYGILRFTPKAASEILHKLLRSAEANAVNNFELDESLLYVHEAYVSQGPTLKRMRAAAKGRGVRILKRTSNITLVVKEREIQGEVH